MPKRLFPAPLETSPERTIFFGRTTAHGSAAGFRNSIMANANSVGGHGPVHLDHRAGREAIEAVGHAMRMRRVARHQMRQPPAAAGVALKPP